MKDDQPAKRGRQVHSPWRRATATFFYVAVPFAFLAAGIINFEIYGQPLNLATLLSTVGVVFGLLIIPSLIVLVCHFVFRKSGKFVPIPHVVAGIVFLFMIFSSYNVAYYEMTGSLSP